MYERIAALCKAKGWTIQTLERLSGLSNGSIGSWRRSVPRADALMRVAAALGTSTDYLLTGVYSYPATGDVVEESTYGMLQRLKDDSRYRVMFDLAKDATPEEIKATAIFLRSLKEARDDDNA